MPKFIAIVLVCIFCVGCQSVFAPKIGMAEKQWLRRTLIGDLAYQDANWRVWKSGNTFYYFRDGKLDHVDQGQLMQQRFQVEVIHK